MAPLILRSALSHGPGFRMSRKTISSPDVFFADPNRVGHGVPPGPRWPFTPSIARKFFTPDIIVIDRCCIQDFPNTFNHRRRSSHIIDGILQLVHVPLQHRCVQVASLSIPAAARTLRLGHDRDQTVIRVAALKMLKFFKEWSIFWPAIKIKKHKTMLQLAVCRIENDAAKRCNANSPRKHHCRTPGIVVQDEVSERTLNLELCSRSGRRKGLFEGRIPHPSRYQKCVFIRRACEGETTNIAFGVGLSRIQEGYIHKLPCLKGPAWRPIKPECHSLISHLPTSYQT